MPEMCRQAREHAMVGSRQSIALSPLAHFFPSTINSIISSMLTHRSKDGGGDRYLAPVAAPWHETQG